MQIRLSDFVAEFLVKKGIKDVFSITGGGAMFLNDALGKNKDLKVTYNHHEQACAIAAESYARLTNKIAAVCVTTGPGGTNALTGVMGGWVDSIPMLIISGQVKYSTTIDSTGLNLRQLGDQEFDIVNTVKNMTKYSVMVKDAESILYHLEKAFYLADSGRKGPCWLDIPINIQSTVIETDNLKGFDFTEETEKNYNIDEVIDLISKAKRPLVLAGSGIRLSDTYNEFIKFLEITGLPCMTAWNSNDLLDDACVNYAGRVGTVGNRTGNFALQNCDLLLVLGCRLNIRIISYNWENFAKNAKIIMVDIDENELKKPTLKIDYPVKVDLTTFMPELAEKAIKISVKEWTDYIAKLKKLFKVVEVDYYKQENVNAYCFIDALTKQLKENDTVVCANGSACVVTFQAAVIKKGQRFYTNSGCASMGYGLPASIGACIAKNRNIVYCIEGDGSLQMNIQELQTIVQNKLPIKLIVLNNSGYHSIRQTQKNFFGQPLVGVGIDSGDLSFPNLSKIANAYGIEYLKLENMDNMDKIIAEFINKENAVIFEIITNDFAFTPKLSSRKLPDGKMISASLEDMFPFIDRELYNELMIGENNKK